MVVPLTGTIKTDCSCAVTLLISPPEAQVGRELRVPCSAKPPSGSSRGLNQENKNQPRASSKASKMPARDAEGAPGSGIDVSQDFVCQSGRKLADGSMIDRALQASSPV